MRFSKNVSEIGILFNYKDTNSLIKAIKMYLIKVINNKVRTLAIVVRKIQITLMSHKNKMDLNNRDHSINKIKTLASNKINI